MLSGRIAMVTGVGSGLGRDIALALAAEGSDILLVARSDRVVPEVIEEIQGMGRTATPIYGDISVGDDCRRIAHEAAEVIGRDRGVDILVNSAFHGGKHVRFDESDIERWRSPMDVNYFGTLQLTQAMLGLIKKASASTGDARIIMINTMSVQRIEKGAGAYAGSKAALGAATRTLAAELGEFGIRVNAVHPGYIWGDNVRAYFEWQAAERGADVTWQDIYDERAAETALGYLPHSSEIAGAVVFFASPLARCVTGTSLPVNAGHWISPSS